MNERMKRLYNSLIKKDIDGLIVSSASNITYLTGFISRDSWMLVSPGKNLYFTDSRYTEEVRDKLKGVAALKKTNGAVFKHIAQACIDLKLKRVGFEEKNLSFAGYKKIKAGLGGKNKLLPTCKLVEELRQTKEETELQKIRKAIQITALALGTGPRGTPCKAKSSRPNTHWTDKVLIGKKEVELAADLERLMKYQGAQGAAFDIIVASGPNSSLPHHAPSQTRIKMGQPLLVDLGADFSGYKSDLTRVFFPGKMKVQAKMIFDIVLEAQRRAIEKIKPGVIINEVDAAARRYITQKGYGRFFSHNLGHGVGLDVHEEPRICPKSTDTLIPGMVFTVEPAIYLPGKFGIRIEDMVLVTKKGCEVLSGSINK